MHAVAHEKFLFADKVEYNAEEEYAEASGHVRIVLDKYTIYADRVFYDITKDEVWGYGNVSAFNNNAQIALGDAVLLKDHAKQVIIRSFILYFKTSDAVIAAALAKRDKDGNSHLTNAIYTSCPTCRTSKPLWQISAKKADILHDKHRVVYKNMFFQIYGVPVAFFPYFSHPIPGAPPKSGILMPDLQGKKFGIPIYIRAKSNMDATITPRYSKKSILYEGEFRHMLRQGSYKFTGSFTSHKPTISNIKNGVLVSQKRIHRYNYSGDGHFINSSDIHYGFNINKVSDRGFLREYYQKHDPFLRSNIFGYKVKKEDYFEINNISLQGLGVKDSAYTDPKIIPEVNFRYVLPLTEMGNSNVKIDNYTAMYSTDALGKITRSVWEINFYNSHITDSGQILGLELYNRSDIYQINLGSHNSNSTKYTTGRSIPELRLSVKYPWVGKIKEQSFVIEPITLFAFGKKHIANPQKFHFIDSGEYEFEDSNFLKYNRYNGFDYHEYGNRVTYGANSLLDTQNGYKIGMFLGQHQRLDKTAIDKPDIVGRASLNFQDHLELYYRFRKNKHFSPIFDEVGVWSNGDKITFNGGLINLHRIDLENTHKIRQIYFDSGYNFDDNWNFGLGSRVDMTKTLPKELTRSIRVTYKGDCVSISTAISQDYTSDSSRAIRKSSDYSFTIRLKTLSM